MLKAMLVTDWSTDRHFLNESSLSQYRSRGRDLMHAIDALRPDEHISLAIFNSDMSMCLIILVQTFSDKFTYLFSADDASSDDPSSDDASSDKSGSFHDLQVERGSFLEGLSS
jgi:hypothetical protein